MFSSMSINVTPNMVEKLRISANATESYPVLHGCKVTLSDGRKIVAMLQTREVNSLIQAIAGKRIKYANKGNFDTYNHESSAASAEQILTRIFKPKEAMPTPTTFTLKIMPFPGFTAPM
jgi:hypothetical protein